MQESHRSQSKDNADHQNDSIHEESVDKEFENVYVSADLTKRMERSDTTIQLCI